MWDPWDVAHAMHDATINHQELYSFIDISQNNHQKGQTHYENALKRRAAISEQPRPLTNVKIYGADGGRFGDTQDGIEGFWRNIFGGHAAARFHRPPSGIGLSERAQRMIRSAREVTAAFDLFATAPRNDLLSGREDNEVYCLAEPGKQYAAYFPKGGEVTLDVSGARGPLTLRWYDIDRRRWLSEETVEAERTIALKTPATGQWAAVIR